MGEIYVLVVDPDFQKRGIGKLLMEHAFKQSRAAGMKMIMVETGDDDGHAPARAAYESNGFERWPVARYFKELNKDDTSRP
jgi:ribosomal protein S18 acetylase RimI-like enzyme